MIKIDDEKNTSSHVLVRVRADIRRGEPVTQESSGGMAGEGTRVQIWTRGLATHAHLAFREARVTELCG